MKDKRFVAVVASFLLLFAVLQTRLVGLAMNTQSAQAAAVQSSCLLPLFGGRAEIVFRNVEAYLNGQPENICKL